MGIAGENRCRNANIMTDNEENAIGGFGAVMGSKNLKAIAVCGTGKIPVAHPKALKALNLHAIELNRRDPMFIPFPKEQVPRIGKASCYQCGLDCMYRFIGKFIWKGSGIKKPMAEPPTAALTETLGTKGGGFLPFQALRNADCLRTATRN